MKNEKFPLVSCIMVTTAKRIKYIPLALRVWWEQTYANSELIIVTEDDLSDFIPVHPRIKVILCEPATVGKKRNIACNAAKGEIIVHFDDDDWYGPTRVEDYVKLLIKNSDIYVIGYNRARYYEVDTKIARTYTFPRKWVSGSSLCYRKSFWETNKFPDISVGEDNAFIEKTPPIRIMSLDGYDSHILRDHNENTWNRKKYYEPTYWKIIDARKTEILLNSYQKTKIVLGLLSWNNKEDTLKHLGLLCEEAENLRKFNFDPRIVVVDNGSKDGTQKGIKEKFGGIHKILNKKNLGSAIARNQIIDYSVKIGSEFIFFIDCDIAIIPFSVMELFRWLREHANFAYCVGANCFADVKKPELAHPYCLRLTPSLCQIFCAMTQYGLFYTNILNKYRFDEHYGPGWGFEDNDLDLTIQHYTGLRAFWNYMPYLHQHAHYSINEIKNKGQDPEKMIRERYAYAIEKWKNVPKFAELIQKMDQERKTENKLIPFMEHIDNKK